MFKKLNFTFIIIIIFLLFLSKIYTGDTYIDDWRYFNSSGNPDKLQ
jgi:hypothetical protein